MREFSFQSHVMSVLSAHFCSSAKTALFVFAVLLSGAIPALATTWFVGPTQKYKLPSEIVSLVQSGDTVNIYAGDFYDKLCIWQPDSIVFRNIGYHSIRLLQDRVAPDPTGIWVIEGQGCEVNRLRFSNARNADSSGTAITIRHGSVRIQECTFDSNQRAVYVESWKGTSVHLDGNHIWYCGTTRGLPVVEAMGIDTLNITYTSFDSNLGSPEVRSRARVTTLAMNARASYFYRTRTFLSVPTGGSCTIISNVMVHRGPTEEQISLIQYGGQIEDKSINHALQMYFNTILNVDMPITAVSTSLSDSIQVVISSNYFAGLINPYSGSPNTIDSSYNLSIGDLQQTGFIGVQHLPDDSFGADLHLTSTSVARGKANPNPQIIPTMEFKHLGFRVRPTAYDVGAFEFDPLSSVAGDEAESTTMSIYPNPVSASTVITVNLQADDIGCDVVISNTQGLEFARFVSTSTTEHFSSQALPAGTYFARCGSHVTKFCILP
jgi:hypothetical protein